MLKRKKALKLEDFKEDKIVFNFVDFRSRRFACLRAVREPPQASPSGVSPVPSSRGRLRAFHFNQLGDFIYLSQKAI
ncbi:hypothetical protein [Sutcliffiella horikoshii]|uniref:hypothetical protein n=1 Tax=Sutcliffiella horikoshii TaxID=79883 RepID=UPI001CFE8D2A|nr:hypothetical protein [Sutcliffiella horikoshii]